MPIQEYIKHGYEHEGKSISELARCTEVSWKTAAKYAKREDWNCLGCPQPRRKPIMDPVADIVDTWLLEDQLLPRKQRRNAARIHEQLCQEHNFQGSARTVREYVQHRRPELLEQTSPPYVELDHPPGCAQVDFGHDQAVRDGKIVTIYGLRISFPYSNAAFVVPLPSENQECFLEGLKRIFERIGGVPSHITFDNLSAAVTHVGKGQERVLTELFRRFALHYGFQANFCAPAKGNEKGHVENKVGYTRRRWMTPLQSVDSFEELDKRLHELALEDMKRPHYKKDETIAVLWQEDQNHLRSLPKTEFEVSYPYHARLNNYGQFVFKKETYDVPQGKPKQKVLLIVFWDRLEVFDKRGNRLTVLNRHYMLKEKEIDWAANFIIYSQRPRACVHAALFQFLPNAVQAFLKNSDPDSLPERIRLIRDMLKSYSMIQIANALGGIPADRQDDRAYLKQMLYTQDPKNASPLPLSNAHTPHAVLGLEPDNGIYDQLAPNKSKGGDAYVAS